MGVKGLDGGEHQPLDSTPISMKQPTVRTGCRVGLNIVRAENAIRVIGRPYIWAFPGEFDSYQEDHTRMP